jgi:hypothetical protein
VDYLAEPLIFLSILVNDMDLIAGKSVLLHTLLFLLFHSVDFVFILLVYLFWIFDLQHLFCLGLYAPLDHLYIDLVIRLNATIVMDS